MRRTRRHKFLQISILFLVYSIIHALCQSQIEEHSDSSKIDVEPNHRHTARRLIKRNPSDTTNPNKNDVTKETTSSTSTTTTTGSTPTTPSTTSTSTHSTLSTSTARSTHSTSTTTTVASTTKSKSSQDASNEHGEKVKEKTKPASETPTKTKEESKGASGNKSEIHKEGAPQITTTVKTIQEEIEPDERNCTPPAIQQFPKPLIDPYARKHGAIIIHILVAVYTFFGLAIVCDEYFVASLDRICEELKMSPDVAGATFMAAGSSAPELATVIIGVFFAKDDIGISGVIGSAVFNIMFVISVCALCSGTVAYLNWWPLVRDCFFYAVSILVLLISIYNKRISWIESTCMLLMYGVYCVALHFNSQLERWAQTWPVPCKKPPPATEQSGLVTYKTLDEDTKNQNYGAATPEYDFTKAWDDPNQGYADQLRGPELNQIDNAPPPAPSAPPAAPVVSSNPYRQDYYRPKEYDPSTLVDPLVKPADGSLYVQAKWYLIYPIHFMCKKTMPDCRSERYKNWYPFTFFISMVWISFYSYFMVWMITIIGSTLAIPDTVMGLTFVAAGVSVPDALSSIAVIKEGYGDMAVSNAIGSNVFDILMCLGLPWFIKTAIVKPGSEVRVISKGLTYSTLSLLSTVVFLLVATHLNGWKLDRKFGIILMVWYLIFITFASMYELNVFGPMNPPECPTDY